jgi:hypothetical protein
MALGMLLGSLVIVDVRLLGFARQRQSPAQLYKYLSAWTRLGIGVMVLTGVPMFMSEAQKLSNSDPFFYKMIFLSLALITHFTIHKRAITHEGLWLGKLAACVSLICWLGVALAGRAIAFV